MITVKCPACRDWELPSTSGLGLLEALRRHEQTCPSLRGINSLRRQNDESADI